MQETFFGTKTCRAEIESRLNLHRTSLILSLSYELEPPYLSTSSAVGPLLAPVEDGMQWLPIRLLGLLCQD